MVPECCGLVWNAVRAQDARGGRHVAVYWDARIRLEVGVELLGPFRDDGEVVRSATPGGWVAAVTHFGSYSGLGGAHSAIRDWCNAHQRLSSVWPILRRGSDPARQVAALSNTRLKLPAPGLCGNLLFVNVLFRRRSLGAPR